MKHFLLQLGLFMSGFLFLMLIGVLIPAPPMVRQSFLFSKIDKDSLLKNTPSPRIVLIGGSNTSFSIDSQMLKDSLHRNPVNTGISGALGLLYMLDSSVDKIRRGDVVIVCPEYSQFYGDAAYGEDYLIRTIMDISPEEILTLNGKQLSTQLSFLPRYAFTKFKVTDYFAEEQDPIKKTVYQRVAFNQYGDVYKHWAMTQMTVEPYGKLGTRFNQQVVDKLYRYKQQVEKKGGKLFVTFPAFQLESFNNQREEIRQIELALRGRGFNLLGNPERYKVSNDVIFDTPYHLTRDGVQMRTQLLIDDLQKANVATVEPKIKITSNRD